MCFFGHSLLPQAARCGEIDDDLDIDELLSLLAQKRSKYKHIWRDFKNCGLLRPRPRLTRLAWRRFALNRLMKLQPASLILCQTHSMFSKR